jgi:hypothetical protein
MISYMLGAVAYLAMACAVNDMFVATERSVFGRQGRWVMAVLLAGAGGGIVISEHRATFGNTHVDWVGAELSYDSTRSESYPLTSGPIPSGQPDTRDKGRSDTNNPGQNDGLWPVERRPSAFAASGTEFRTFTCR